MLWLAAIYDVEGGACGFFYRHTSVHCQPGRQGGMYLDCVHSAGSVTVLQVTGSPLLLILLCRLIIVSVRSNLSFEGKQVYCEKSSPGSLGRLLPYIKNRWCTVTVYIASSAMTSGYYGGGRPRIDRSRVTFRNELQIAWKAPESYVTLDSPGVVELGTSFVSDVLGLRVHYQNAGPTWLLPGRAQNSGCVLIPDARVVPWGFHDVTLVDMLGETGPEVAMEDMCNLRRQWTTSLLAGVSRRQTDLESHLLECKNRFRNSQAGRCIYCG